LYALNVSTGVAGRFRELVDRLVTVVADNSKYINGAKTFGFSYITDLHYVTSET
jgi:hypothetical protein